MLKKRLGIRLDESSVLSSHIFDKRDENNNRTTFRIFKYAKKAMDMRVIQDGYGFRGKSRWIMDITNEFIDPKTWDNLSIENTKIWQRIVIDTELQKENMVKDAINISEEMRIQLCKASIEAALYGASLEEPIYLEITIASIIRAAIMWKIGQNINSIY
jgi:hypothetical protein